MANLKNIRKELGYTMKELALMVGVSEATISRWESGDIANMKQNNIVSLADALNVSPLDILNINDTNTNIDHTNNSYKYKFFPVSISAGALENISCVLDYDLIPLSDKLLGKYARNKNIILLKVNGESMNNIIPDGSYIIVDTSKTSVIDINNNDIVVFSENGSYSVKRFLNDPGNNRFLFKPDSTDGTFTPIEIHYENSENLKLIGKVVKYIVSLD
ncbi:MAG: XRE family transcriptional regulator [Peptostreptococcus sp.]|uniref:LexA family protein n=1 Tax=Peptostreptococcus TaxID=1257 RepID=UPI0029007EDE|nr:XRE family transcriptional regulator [Peptostreptococcus sp.]MDU1265363.1 XRE family transcriptional regulator [Peptostreptococcus sp.]